MDEVVDHDARSGDARAEESQGLAERRERREHPSGHAEVLDQTGAPLTAVDSGRVGIVDDELGSVTLDQLGVRVERSDVAGHAEERLRHDERSTARVWSAQLALERRDVEVGHDDLPGSREAHSVDEARVVLLVGDHAIRLADESREHRDVGEVAAREDQRRLGAEERGQTRLQLEVVRPCCLGGAAKRARRWAARSSSGASPADRRAAPDGEPGRGSRSTRSRLLAAS